MARAHRLRVALVEPFLGGSHRAWAEGLARHSAHDVELISLPAAHWKWRMQGGHLSLAPKLADAVRARGPFDRLLASGMTNVAALLGHARSLLGSIPTLLYMHENQLTYPVSGPGRVDLTYAMINWSSMAAADAVAFNSAFHRDAWFEALPGLLGRLPDHRADSLVAAVRDRCTVVPVGIEVEQIESVERSPGARPLLLWNQRWEHDKGPDELAAAVTAIVDSGLDVDVALAGERYTEEPASLVDLRLRLGDRLVHDGYASRSDYLALLRRADVVVSTARHEFFGVAVAEAIAAGAFPILPNRLVYPERIPPEHHASCLYDTSIDLVERLAWAIGHPREAAAVATALRPTILDLDWANVAPVYDRVLAELA